MYYHILALCSCIGIPVAWGITDTEDTRTYTEFFSVIKKKIPDATIHILMTDDGMYLQVNINVSIKHSLDPAMIGGCSAVYPQVTHLLCRWHVDR